MDGVGFVGPLTHVSRTDGFLPTPSPDLSEYKGLYKRFVDDTRSLTCLMFLLLFRTGDERAPSVLNWFFCLVVLMSILATLLRPFSTQSPVLENPVETFLFPTPVLHTNRPYVPRPERGSDPVLRRRPFLGQVVFPGPLSGRRCKAEGEGVDREGSVY